MAQLDGNFNAEEVQPNTGFPVYPEGDYKAQAVRSEWKATKDGTGQYLEIGVHFMGGPYDGQEYVERLNLKHSKQSTVDMAKRQLSALCHATGQLHISDSEQLHFKPFSMKLTHSPRKDKDGKPTGEMQNNAIYKALGAGTTTAAQPTANAQAAAGAPAPAAAAAAAAGTKTPPWKKQA